MGNKKKKPSIHDISSEESNDRLEDFNRQEDIKKVEGIRFLLKQKEFRTWLWDLLGDCKMFESSFTGNSTTFFNEGMRSIGLKKLQEVLNVDTKAYLAMIEESQQREVLKKEKLND